MLAFALCSLIGCSSPTSSTSFESTGTGLLDCDESAGCKQSLKDESACREETDAHTATLERELPELETLAVYLVRAEETEGAESAQAANLRKRIEESEDNLRAAIARVRACRQFLSPNFGPSPFGPSIHSDEIARDLCTTGHSKFAGVSVLHRAIDPIRGRG